MRDAKGKGAPVAATTGAPPHCPAGCTTPGCLGPGGIHPDYDPNVLGPWLTGPVKPKRKPINGRDKGLNAERQLANWLVGRGWPDARRSVATGWRTKDREHQDQGDITGTPGLCFQLKNVADPPDETAELARWISETGEQAGPDRVPLLVVKRAGRADPGDWHLWIRASWLIELQVGMPHDLTAAGYWVRVQLDRVADRLLAYSRSRNEER